MTAQRFAHGSGATVHLVFTLGFVALMLGRLVELAWYGVTAQRFALGSRATVHLVFTLGFVAPLQLFEGVAATRRPLHQDAGHGVTGVPGVRVRSGGDQGPGVSRIVGRLVNP